MNFRQLLGMEAESVATVPAADAQADESRHGRLSRRNLLWAYAGLLAASIAFDFSVYPGGVTHVYLHDLTALPIGALGVLLAFRNRTVVSGGKWFLIPIGLLVFLLANTVLVGALQYHNVPADQRKLFWFEHGDGFRIIGELFVWVWAFGHLRPSREEVWRMLDIVLWGSTVAVALTVAYSIATDTPHATTTGFDVDVLTGLPLAVVFVVRTRPRRVDLGRLAVMGAGSVLLYSRATIVTVAFTTVAVLIATRDWRKVGTALGSMAVGWLIVLAIPLLLYGSMLGASTFLRVLSIGDQNLAPYTIPNRVAIWRDALRVSKISPVIGVGYHDYFLYGRVSEGSHLELTDLFSSRIKSAHNDYLSWLSETGVLGLGAFLGFWGSALLFAFRFWRREPQEVIRHTFTLALIVAMLGISFVGEVLIPRAPIDVPQAAIWWIVLGLLFIDAGRKGSLERAHS